MTAHTQTNAINVRQLLNSRPVGAYQKFIVLLSFLIVVMDGFDVVIMGFVVPALKEQWNWTNTDLAPVLSAALIGLTIGALTAGPLGDKFGRRKVLCSCVMLFGLFTLLVATASSKSHFIVYRFIAGIAMGGIMPMAATLVKEFSPAKKSSLLVTIVFAGFTVGAAGGGFLAKWLVPQYGWESVFYIGGILPILVSIVMGFTLPESLTYLVLKNKNQAEIRKIVEKCAPGSTTEHSTFIVPQPPTVEQTQNPIKIALNPFYRLGSLTLWAGYFFHLFLFYLLSSWLPIMLKESGMTYEQSTMIASLFQLGGPLGSIAQGWLMDKFEQNKVIITAYILGAILLFTISNIGGNYVLLCATAFIMGACFAGAGTAFNALSSNFFPLPARATGNGWMHGIGRTGAIISSYAGAWILNAGWSFSAIILALIVPVTCIVVLLFIKYLYYRNTLAASSETAAAAAAAHQNTP